MAHKSSMEGTSDASLWVVCTSTWHGWVISLLFFPENLLFTLFRWGLIFFQCTAPFSHYQNQKTLRFATQALQWPSVFRTVMLQTGRDQQTAVKICFWTESSIVPWQQDERCCFSSQKFMLPTGCGGLNTKRGPQTSSEA